MEAIALLNFSIHYIIHIFSSMWIWSRLDLLLRAFGSQSLLCFQNNDEESFEDEETKSLLSQSDSTMTTGLKSACSELNAPGSTWRFIAGLYLPVFNSSDSFTFLSLGSGRDWHLKACSEGSNLILNVWPSLLVVPMMKYPITFAVSTVAYV